MPLRALTLAEVAAELGLTPRRFHAAWMDLVKQKGMPKPVLEGRAPKWDAAQFYAWKDRALPKTQRAIVAAYRAAYEAASQPSASLLDTSVAEQTAALEARFVKEQAS